MIPFLPIWIDTLVICLLIVLMKRLIKEEVPIAMVLFFTSPFSLDIALRLTRGLFYITYGRMYIGGFPDYADRIVYFQWFWVILLIISLIGLSFRAAFLLWYRDPDILREDGYKKGHEQGYVKGLRDAWRTLQYSEQKRILAEIVVQDAKKALLEGEDRLRGCQTCRHKSEAAVDALNTELKCARQVADVNVRQQIQDRAGRRKRKAIQLLRATDGTVESATLGVEYAKNALEAARRVSEKVSSGKQRDEIALPCGIPSKDDVQPILDEIQSMIDEELAIIEV